MHIMGESVDRTVAAVQLNKTIYLDGPHAKKLENQNFNIGNVPFELIINSNTVIKDLGDYETASEEDILTISLNEVTDSTEKIRVTGYMKTLISLAENQQGVSSQGIGAMTDGRIRLEIHSASINNMPLLAKGQPVEVTGTIHHGKIIYLQVTDGNAIIAKPGTKLTPEELLSITRIPTKRVKLNELADLCDFKP